jgi:cytidyltransferase-like protein
MCSGGFDPLHAGHVEYLRRAADLGDVVVALNSDAWLMRKKGYVFMPWEQRAAVLRALRHVEEVVAVNDADGTVCEAVARLRPDVFANGGDRTGADNTPEAELCRRMGIRLAWGLGAKIASSSDLVRQAAPERAVPAPWGTYTVLEYGPGYRVKRLDLDAGKRTSLQRHFERAEDMMLVSGAASLELDGVCTMMVLGQARRVNVFCKHRLGAGDEGATIIEIQTGAPREDDIERLADDYGRALP